MEELYEQNVKIVYHFLYTRCKDAVLAEELVPERYAVWCCGAWREEERSKQDEKILLFLVRDAILKGEEISANDGEVCG